MSIPCEAKMPPPTPSLSFLAEPMLSWSLRISLYAEQSRCLCTRVPAHPCRTHGANWLRPPCSPRADDGSGRGSSSFDSSRSISRSGGSGAHATRRRDVARPSGVCNQLNSLRIAGLSRAHLHGVAVGLSQAACLDVVAEVECESGSLKGITSQSSFNI